MEGKILNIKHLIVCLVIVLAFGIAGFSEINANATENVNNSLETKINDDNSQNILIEGDIVTSFEITIPSMVSLAYDDTTSFEIKGKGNLTKYEYLSVSIPKTVNMKSAGRYSENLKIVSDGNKFTSEQLASDEGGVIHCSINSGILPTGSWSGTMTILVSMEDVYYRIPDANTINYEYSYITATKNGNNVFVYNHQDPLYYFEPTSTYTKGYVTGLGLHFNFTKTYKLQSDGSWTLYSDKSLNENSVSNKISLNQETIVYSNYDIMYADSPSEIWQTRMCPE